jgi:O-acetylhomoserine/O-acetylserine sulfhydrylase-like pyridoxal-dependent enzyme
MPDLIRLCIGIVHIDNIIAGLEQVLEAFGGYA